MPGVKAHLDEFTLLRYTARDLSGEELGTATHHLSGCRDCGSVLVEMQRLDEELRELASAGRFEERVGNGLPPEDPFRLRPSPRRTRRKGGVLGPIVLEASEKGLALRETILEAVRRPETIAASLSGLRAERGEHRFAVLYALQEAGRRSAETPFGTRRLAEETLAWLRNQPGRKAEIEGEPAERMVPRLVLRAQARLLLGIACLWTKDYSEAREHFAVAYRSFGRGGGDVTSLASVELAEAQRRALAGEGDAALPLARRALRTFEEIGLEDYAARAMVAEGLALTALGRHEEAVASYRRALPVFDKNGLWSNSVGALNSTATALLRLGRVAEARREFARAFRRFSQERHRPWLGYLRTGLAEVLFAAGHYSEAAVSAARAVKILEESGMRALMLIAMLLEIECWARCGSLERARRRLDLFWMEVERDGTLDRVVVQKLEAALTGADPNYQRLSSLRSQLSDLIQERYRAG